MAERMTVQLLGRIIGTASGWDGDPGEQIWFYDFEPIEGIDLPKCTLVYHEANGLIGPQNDEDGGIKGVDIVSFLSSIPRSPEPAKPEVSDE